MSNLYYESSNELYHHGIKGQKWGRRRYQNKDGSLTPAGIKRYATQGYTKDSYNQNKGAAGKAYDLVTGAHRTGGQLRYNLSTDKERKARAEKYLKEEARSEQKKQEFREARKDVYANRSTGAKIATNLLAGAFANRTYNSVIAAGGSVNEARAITVATSLISGGSPFGHLAVSALYTHDAGKK